ncbi:Sucrose transport protein SUT4 [Acorus calamus]|uniref:Sucrose transport protein SUT4 n=1 Tax=Acorus calamus TaxID=4465 RepID=A0AAV9E570_ACOCL|nr:Sucrose transport protein SUT4 [Acorus calamus]
MDAVSIHVPYKHLKQSEVELAGLGADRDGIAHVSRVSNGGSDVPLSSPSSPPLQTLSSPVDTSSLKTLILSCMVAAGVQFGWALS